MALHQGGHSWDGLGREGWERGVGERE